MPLWVTIPGTLLLVCGGLLTVIGSFGLVRLPTFFARMHGPSLGNTMGAGCLLISSMLTSSAILERAVLHELVIAGSLFISSPVTAMMLMKAAVYRDLARKRSAPDADFLDARGGASGDDRTA
jgi:multicomponent K+:H+ antiporter subunit G